MVQPQGEWQHNRQYANPVPITGRRPLGALFVVAAMIVLAWCGVCFLACTFEFFASDACPSDVGMACERPIDRAVYLGMGGCALAAGLVVVALLLAGIWTRRRSFLPLLLAAALLAPFAVWLSNHLVAAALP